MTELRWIPVTVGQAHDGRAQDLRFRFANIFCNFNDKHSLLSKIRPDLKARLKESIAGSWKTEPNPRLPRQPEAVCLDFSMRLDVLTGKPPFPTQNPQNHQARTKFFCTVTGCCQIIKSAPWQRVLKSTKKITPTQIIPRLDVHFCELLLSEFQGSKLPGRL